LNYNFLKVEELKELSDIYKWLKKRDSKVSPSIEKKVSKILRKVRIYGDKAIVKLCRKFDGLNIKNIDEIKVKKEEIKEAYKWVLKTYPELVEALDISYKNIKSYHNIQLEKEPDSWVSHPAKGKKIGQILLPIERVGIYIPGGRYIYPSSVLMTVVPAAVAGVKEITMCTPPGKDGNISKILLYLCARLGVSGVYKIGGAQAIAVMAYGTDSIKKVDKIVGPGNVYVTTAKKNVFGVVGIDSLAGPSEIVILADYSANPDFIAADLISQAEHDPDSRSILLSTNEDIAKKVIGKIYKQLGNLEKDYSSRANIKIILESLKRNCKIIYNKDKNFIIEICNRIAPEHLEIMMKDADDILKDIKNAGAIFIGDYTPTAVGDYIGGTNHVIPTNGCARFSSPLGVYDFYKRSSILSYDYKMLEKERKYIEILSDFEKLAAHRNSIKVRFKK